MYFMLQKGEFNFVAASVIPKLNTGAKNTHTHTEELTVTMVADHHMQLDF